MVGVLLVAVVSGCGTGVSAGQEYADERADEMAEHLARNFQRGGFALHRLPVEVAYALRSHDSSVIRGVQLLRMEEQEGDTAVVEVRISVVTEAESVSGFRLGEAREAARAVRCYRYEFAAHGLDGQAQVLPDDCAGRDPLPVPLPPEVANLGDDDDEVVRQALATGAEPEELERLLQRDGVIVRAGSTNGWVGVALLVPPPGDDCLMGRRGPAGEVEVWFPPGVTVAPGEGSCDAVTAATAGAQRSPH
ncbi:hypothetical protein CLV92_1281 [Kineococcus xinjiangensis]|uniref:Uncharacterized protein n=2 Tax=Kineococcus xinjiangensis TaxID=512762 RepID=A0A2S6IBW7_9ACTN|nr:hypothetical protein CLV92_1281 [Kineococcus xinjiangensis]